MAWHFSILVLRSAGALDGVLLWRKGKNGGMLNLKSLKCVSLDLSDGQFSERCDGDGSFFNSDAIPTIERTTLATTLV